MNKVTIVMYHYVRDLANSRFPQIRGLDYSLFKKQIEFFKQNFQVVTMEEVIAAWNENYELPEHALLLTFDDGYIDHYTYVLPVLTEYKMQGSFFIPGKPFTEATLLDVNKIHFILASQPGTVLMQELLERLNYYRGTEYDFPSNEELIQQYAAANRFDTKETIFVKRILQTALPEPLRNRISSDLFAKYVGGLSEEKFSRELYMNYDQIKCMKRNGMYIGIHGYDHYWLGNLKKEDMQQDIQRALEVLDGIVETDRWVMNYPYGSYSKEVTEYLENTGCRLGLTTEVRIADPSMDSRFTLPRLDTNDFPPKSENYKNI